MFFIFFNKLNKVLRVLNKLFIRSYYNFSTFFFRKHWQNIDKLLKISSRMNNFCFDLRKETLSKIFIHSRDFHFFFIT